MKIVVDTNILISGMLWSGPPFRIMNMGGSGKISIGISRAIYTEFRRVLTYPQIEKRLRTIELTARDSEAKVRDCVTFVKRVSDIPAVCVEPSDNEVLACAKDFDAECLITGDKEILEVGKQYLKAPILRASEFLANYFPAEK